MKGADVANTGGFNNLGTAYDQLCTSYHAIDDFRTKLLGFLPLVTGGGLVLLSGRVEDVQKEFFTPVGVFGILVTLGLLAYELGGIKKCRALISDGKALEAEMKMPYGQFTGRPDAVFTLVSKPVAAALIYPAVLAAWTYLALRYPPRSYSSVLSATVFGVAFTVVVGYDRFLHVRDRKILAEKAKAEKASRSHAQATSDQPH